MSLWNAHLTDCRLFECCLADRSGEPADLRAAEHLGDCLACQQRYAEVTDFLEATWNAAEADLDALFSPERLRSQQEQIARRIEQLAQSARVISFPGREARPGRLLPSPSSRAMPRWVASAAVAGLVVGIGIGVFFNPRQALPPSTVVAPGVSTPAAPGAAAPLGGVLAAMDPSEDLTMFLTSSTEGPSAPELEALDALTPRAREISYTIR